MTSKDTVSPAGPQMICADGECERANRLRDALLDLKSAALELNASALSPYVVVTVNDALKEDQ